MKQKWGLLILAPSVVVSPTYAKDYLTTEEAQKILFPQADKFEQQILKLSTEQRDKIKEESGVRQRKESLLLWRALHGETDLGWMIIDDVIGKHEFITYAAAISPQGQVLGIEILSYRETHGGEVRDVKWRDQFKNKTLSDSFKLDEDISNISGATLSCRNITDGVKRLLVLHKVALKK